MFLLQYVLNNVWKAPPPSRDKYGRTAYFIGALQAVPESKAVRYTFTLDGKQTEVEGFTVVQDQAGLLWIGTVDGVNRYSGYDFVVHKPDDEDPNSIGDRYVRALLVDEAGHIWNATRLGGLNKYDPVTQTFTHYKHDPPVCHNR